MTSFSCNKVLAETHESLRSTGCVGSSFWLQISHLLLFLFAPSATAPRGIAAVPRMWRPAVALQFREARPVSVGLWETPSLEAKPSFLTFCHQMSSFHHLTFFSSFQFRQYWYCIWWPTEEVPLLAWERGFSEILILHKYRLGVLFYDISNLKILMSRDSRACKQSILKKWLTEASKNRFSLHQKQAKKKCIRLPHYAQDQHCKSQVLLNDLGLLKMYDLSWCHVTWRIPRKTDFGDTVHGIDTWLYFHLLHLGM